MTKASCANQTPFTHNLARFHRHDALKRVTKAKETSGIDGIKPAQRAAQKRKGIKDALASAVVWGFGGQLKAVGFPRARDLDFFNEPGQNGVQREVDNLIAMARQRIHGVGRAGESSDP